MRPAGRIRNPATWRRLGSLASRGPSRRSRRSAEGRRDLHRFQRDLEEIGIRVCADFGVVAGRVEGWTGVWVGTAGSGPKKKIMSLGIAVRRWVTWHGLALNVSTDLEPFRRFHPCGLDGAVMTSLAECLGRDPAMAAVRDSLVRHASDLLPGGPFVSGAPADLQIP